MPLVKPKKYERKDKFISRCISSKRMEKEFPRKKQRTAVCYSIWRDDKDKEKKSSKKS